MRKFGIIIFTLTLCIGLFGCSRLTQKEVNASIFKEYPKKEIAEVDKIFEKEYIQVVEPYFDSARGSGLFVFTINTSKFILRIEPDDVTTIVLVDLITNQGSGVYHSISHFLLDPTNIAVQNLVVFLDAYSLNYDDFIDWLLDKSKQTLKVGISNLEYNFDIKTQDEVFNILNDKGYTINNPTDPKGVSIKNPNNSIYIEGKHYDITKEDEQPFVTLIIKDSKLSKLNPKLAYYLEYNSEYNYLRTSICYNDNVLTLDMTDNAKSVAGDLIEDKANIISEKDLLVIKEYHSKIESWLQETGITIADLCFFGMSYYGAYIK
ncbi:MAG: hypothetical protein RR585_12770 [Coprobacillus sp.]